MTGAGFNAERGVGIVSRIVNDRLKWIFRRTHNEQDFGIDGYIDIVDDQGNVTGKSLAVQIKCGESFFKNKYEDGYAYFGETKHLNYLLNHPVKVLIIICNPTTETCLWKALDPLETQPTSNGWKIQIPQDQEFQEGSKSTLVKLAGPITDYMPILREYWSLNNLIEEADNIHYIIDKGDILKLNFENIVGFFERLHCNKNFARKNQGKVVISIWGYEKDDRELYQIKEVRAWFNMVEPIVKYWFYFLRTDTKYSGLRLLPACVCKIKIKQYQNKKVLLEYNSHDLAEFFKRNYIWLNEMTLWIGMTIEENKNISNAVSRCIKQM